MLQGNNELAGIIAIKKRSKTKYMDDATIETI